jgi:hypothetical protein
MTDTAAITETADDPTTDLRARLREAIAKRDSERKKLTALEAAQTKAQSSLREAERQQRDAESALRDARNRESLQLACAFAAGNDLRDDPVALAQAST